MPKKKPNVWRIRAIWIAAGICLLSIYGTLHQFEVAAPFGRYGAYAAIPCAAVALSAWNAERPLASLGFLGFMYVMSWSACSLGVGLLLTEIAGTARQAPGHVVWVGNVNYGKGCKFRIAVRYQGQPVERDDIRLCVKEGTWSRVGPNKPVTVLVQESRYGSTVVGLQIQAR